MNPYKVTQRPLTLAPGIVVRLTAQQAAGRQAALRKRPDGAYDVLQPVHFKKGEVLGFDDVPNKTVLSAFFSVENSQEIQAKTAAKPVKPNPKPLDNPAAKHQEATADGRKPTTTPPANKNRTTSCSNTAKI